MELQLIKTELQSEPLQTEERSSKTEMKDNNNLRQSEDFDKEVRGLEEERKK